MSATESGLSLKTTAQPCPAVLAEAAANVRTLGAQVLVLLRSMSVSEVGDISHFCESMLCRSDSYFVAALIVKTCCAAVLEERSTK